MMERKAKIEEALEGLSLFVDHLSKHVDRGFAYIESSKPTAA